jgi:hypothetical protein
LKKEIQTEQTVNRKKSGFRAAPKNRFGLIFHQAVSYEISFTAYETKSLVSLVHDIKGV